MFNVDMIGWHANGENSYVKDYFSVEKNIPPEDTEQNLTNEEVKFVAKDPEQEKDYDKVTFVTYRDLETTDKEQDFVVPLDEEIEMAYAFLSASYEWREHTRRGEWSMKVHQRLGNPDFGKNDDTESEQSKTPQKGGDSFVLISALVFGSVVLIALIVTVIYYCILKRK